MTHLLSSICACVQSIYVRLCAAFLSKRGSTQASLCSREALFERSSSREKLQSREASFEKSSIRESLSERDSLTEWNSVQYRLSGSNRTNRMNGYSRFVCSCIGRDYYNDCSVELLLTIVGYYWLDAKLLDWTTELETKAAQNWISNGRQTTISILILYMWHRWLLLYQIASSNPASVVVRSTLQQLILRSGKHRTTQSGQMYKLSFDLHLGWGASAYLHDWIGALSMCCCPATHWQFPTNRDISLSLFMCQLSHQHQLLLLLIYITSVLIYHIFGWRIAQSFEVTVRMIVSSRKFSVRAISVVVIFFWLS